MSRFVCAVVFATLFSGAGCDRSHQQSQPSTGQSEPDSTEQEIPMAATHSAAARLDARPPGIHEQMIRRPDGSTLRFTISIPESYSDGVASPLIVALHYGGDVTPFYGRGMIDVLVGPSLEALGAIVVAPDSIAGDWTNSTNETAVLQIMDSVMASYNVDRSKTLLTGYSMGGEGTWWLAGRNQDRFSAAIPIAGTPTTDADWKIPLYVIHSRADHVIPLEPTRHYVEQLKAAGSDVNLVIVDDVTHYETQRLQGPLRETVPWIKNVWK